MEIAAIACLCALALFGTAMVHITVTDLREMRIRNNTLLCLLASYPALAIAADLPWWHITGSVLVGSLVFLGGFSFFVCGLIGGGDAKLAAVAGIWLGADLVLPYLMLLTLFGGVFSLAVLVWRRMQIPRSRMQVLPGGTRYLPYGPGMACAALVLLAQTEWARGI